MLNKIISLLLNYKCSIMYIVLIVVINALFSYVPLTTILGSAVSPMDGVVGIVYVLRDFSQRELQHKVILAMLIGSVLSFYLADHAIAVASISAFLVAECVDWAVYTLTRRPLAQRLLWSASLSVPVDSVVFLAVAHQLTGLGVAILTLAKMAGVITIWLMWHSPANRRLFSKYGVNRFNRNAF